MKKNRRKLSGCLLLTALLAATVVFASGAGTADDPLVTLSYLNDTFMDELLEEVDAKIAAAGGGQAGESADSFVVVTLSQGQVLSGDIGCEVMLRVGTAACVSTSSPGLIDETDASILENGGALVKNHLYMMTIEGRGVKATAATTKLMVRGGYTVS